MILDDIPNGAKVYVDANIFLYIALGRGTYIDSCNRFLDGIGNAEINAYISPVVLDEVLFKLMQSEIAVNHKIPLGNVPQLIKKNPRVISKLTKCWEAIDTILSIGITVLRQSSDFNIVVDACRNYNLLTKDALHVSIMKTHNLTNIASNDSDFERVDWIKLYKPSRKE